MMTRGERNSSNVWMLHHTDVNVEKGAVRVEQAAKHAAVVSALSFAMIFFECFAYVPFLLSHFLCPAARSLSLTLSFSRRL